MKAVILARVSTEEQKEAGNSLPAQVERLKKYCLNKGLQVARTFSFDESAYKTKRDEFDKILDYLKEHKEKVAVCFDKVDRFSRNVFDKRVAILYDLAMQDKIELHFASDNLVITPDVSATGKFHFGMNLGLAKYYSDAISDNVKRAYEIKRRNGEWTGKAPIGYKNERESDIRTDIIPDPERSHLIIKIFELYATGNYSLGQIRDRMKELGLKGTIEEKPVALSMIHNIIKNPFYYGVMNCKGVLYPHKYQPLISHELFEKVQAVRLGWHKKPFQYAAKPFILRGLITCKNCGCTITPELKKGKYVYYSCANGKKMCTRVWIREEELLKPIYDALDAIQMPDKKIVKIVDGLKRASADKTAFHHRIITNLDKEYEKLQNRLDSLLDFLLDKSITKDEYDTKLKLLKEKQQDILLQKEEHTKADENFYLTAAHVFSIAKRAKEIFMRSEIEEKRQLLNFLLQNCKLDGKKLSFELKTPFDRVLEANNCTTMLRR